MNAVIPCTKCGCCCKRVGRNMDVLKEYGFPYQPKDDGSCEKLLPDNTCAVYDKRPFICDSGAVVAFMLTHHYEADILKFIDDNIEQCNKMMDDDGVDQSFRIPINKPI